MKVVFVLLDSLNRKAMEPYGATSVQTPHFKRFQQRAVTFDNHYVGSLPCMPARRDLHTGRSHFLHRSWGPLEPFDDSFPELMKLNGIYSHLITDHHHYFADGGATYHQRYSSWELVRGQAIDRWKAEVAPDLDHLKEKYHPIQHHRTNYMINREYMREEKDYCSPQLFEMADIFLKKNHQADNWLLQLECFDPHEPFHAPQRFKDLYKTSYDGPILDWPIYDRVTETPEEVAEMRANYAALVTMTDEYFGTLLDFFDEQDLWSDTALVLTTDHGFLLGEHDWWAKNRMPVYDEIAHIPLMIYHPDHAKQGGTRRTALTQTTDIMPTLLDMVNLPVPEDVTGKSLMPVLDRDQSLRDSVIFGYFGAAVNVTDGQHSYFHYPVAQAADHLYEYTLMPTRMTSRFSIKELLGATLHPSFSFTKGTSVLKLDPKTSEAGDPVEVQGMQFMDTDSALFDLTADPMQSNPIEDVQLKAKLQNQIIKNMEALDAPPEAFLRFGFPPPEER
ncbi:sulfatase-like hydrolase/transferase [Alphaproteobacteria bacterium]|nr:sulfatase-like hydrolase/transferase [Alphaproteobacteria bacterium]